MVACEEDIAASAVLCLGYPLKVCNYLSTLLYAQNGGVHCISIIYALEKNLFL